MPDLLRTSRARLFIIEDGAGPAQVPEYLGRGRAGAVDWPQGDSTPVFEQSISQYDRFEIIDLVQGTPGLPSMPIEARKFIELSDLLTIVRKGCPVDIHIHAGTCEDPSDFDEGWELAIVLEGARPTSYGTNELGAFDAAQQADVVETVPFTGLDYYELKPLLGSEQAAAEISDEIVAVSICDDPSCGFCGVSSDGCQVVFALTIGSGNSPGLPAELLYTSDQGGTWNSTNIGTLGLAEAPSGMACVGANVVVISADANALFYAPSADILAGTESWTEVSTGFVALKLPNDIYSVGRTRTMIVGDGGYIYRTSDVTSGVTVVSAGSVTAQNLNRVIALDRDNWIAVGESNAVVITRDGGGTWSLVVGPAVGVSLTAVWMRSKLEWFIGTAGGNLYYTRDGGVSWTLKTFPGSAAGAVRDIQFSTRNVGYIAHDSNGAGRILRTISGGNSWYALPEQSGQTLPANDRVNRLAACREDPNLVFGGGLGSDGSDGFLVKVA